MASARAQSLKSNFTTTTYTLDEITDIVTTAAKRADRGRAEYDAAQAALAAIPTTYAGFASALNAAAAGDEWPQAKTQKDALDQITIDYTDLKNDIDAIIAAIDAVA